MILKKILAALLCAMLVVGIVPTAVLAEETHEHTLTLPTAEASGSSDTPLITIGAISDPHVDYGLQNTAPYVRTAFITAMDALKAENPDLILVGGDMTSDNEDNGGSLRWERSVYDRTIAAFKKYASAASKTGITLWALGNHDYEVGRLNEASETAGDYNSYVGFMDMMLETAGQPKSLLTQNVTGVGSGHWLGAHYVVNGFDFIIINQNYRTASGTSGYPAETLAWLDNTLNGIGADKTVFITGHYPLSDNKGLPSKNDGLQGAGYTNFYNVLKKYKNAIYLYGHEHGGRTPQELLDSTYISSDAFERITHYNSSGAVVTSRSALPTSFITAFMGSAAFYNYSLNPGWLGGADPEIIQAMTITVYKDRIEFKVINTGKQHGFAKDPLVWTVKRDVLNSGTVNVSAPAESYALPSDIISKNNCASGQFSLHYMDIFSGTLYNDFQVSANKDYVNVEGGHSKGLFATSSSAPGEIYVFPEYKKSAVIKFTAPKDGAYEFDATVMSYALTSNGGANRQVIYSVMKNGVVYDITQPTYDKNFIGKLKGTVNLKKGEELLFLADQYVKYELSEFTSADHNGYAWVAGKYLDLKVSRVGNVGDTNATTYSYDGTGLNFTEEGYSIKANDHFSLAAISVKDNRLLIPLQYGITPVYQAEVGAAMYKKSGSAGEFVTIAYRNSADTAYMYGPFGTGNADKNVAAAVAFTAPQSGFYNLTALVSQDWSRQATANYGMVYEIRDSALNVVFSGSTSNSYAGTNVRSTYSRAGGTVYLKKGQSAYLSFRAAPEANRLETDTIAMYIENFSATLVPCDHEWNKTEGKCNLCGTYCEHAGANTATCKSASVCPTCGYVVAQKNPNNHVDKNGKYTSKNNGTHSFNRTCCNSTDIKSQACTFFYGACSKCGYRDPDSAPSGGYVPPVGNLAAPNPNANPANPTLPEDTTNPDDMTDPEDTTDPDVTEEPDVTEAPDVQENNGAPVNNTEYIITLVLVIVLAAANVAGVVVLVVILVKNKKAKQS